MEDERFAAVLAAAAAGREEAFAELWREVNPSLVRYLRVGARDRSEDLASETWLQVARDLRRFSGTYTGFRAWVFAVARNRLIDHKRSPAGRVPVAPVTAGPDAAAPDPADVVEERISTERALALIATLPPDQAEVIALRVVAGFGVADVARILRKRPGTVRVLAHRGLRALAARLDRPL